MTGLVMRATARAGSLDSAAATVVISAPVSEKNTVTAPGQHRDQPLGHEAAVAVRLPKVDPVGEVQPKAKAAASAMKTMIAATLMEANQNSNSP